MRDARRTLPKGGRPSEIERKERVREIDSIIGSRGKAVADARDHRAKSGERLLAVGRSIEKSAIPVAGNIEFPPNWVELSKKRTVAKMTAAERAIMKSLGTVIDFE